MGRKYKEICQCLEGCECVKSRCSRVVVGSSVVVVVVVVVVDVVVVGVVVVVGSSVVVVLVVVVVEVVVVGSVVVVVGSVGGAKEFIENIFSPKFEFYDSLNLFAISRLDIFQPLTRLFLKKKPITLLTLTISRKI